MRSSGSNVSPSSARSAESACSAARRPPRRPRSSGRRPSPSDARVRPARRRPSGSARRPTPCRRATTHGHVGGDAPAAAGELEPELGQPGSDVGVVHRHGMRSLRGLAPVGVLGSSRRACAGAAPRGARLSFIPPQTPCGSRVDRACSRQGSRTGHRTQSAFAMASRASFSARFSKYAGREEDRRVVPPAGREVPPGRGRDVSIYSVYPRRRTRKACPVRRDPSRIRHRPAAGQSHRHRQVVLGVGPRAPASTRRIRPSTPRTRTRLPRVDGRRSPGLATSRPSRGPARRAPGARAPRPTSPISPCCVSTIRSRDWIATVRPNP